MTPERRPVGVRQPDVICLLALTAITQGPFDTKITIEMKDALASEAVAEIGKQGHFKCRFGGDDNLKVTVFAKGVPAKVLLERIGDTLGYKPVIEGDSYRFTPSEARKAQAKYLDAEATLRNSILLGRLEALAKLTSQPFSQSPRQTPATPPGEVERADHWAARRINRPAYYALGMAYRQSTSEAGASGTHTFLNPNPGPILASDATYSFFIESPAQKPVVQTFIDENSAGLRGTMIAWGLLNSTAEIKVSAIEGDRGEGETLLDRPFLFATPPKALGNHRFAQSLKAWTTPVKSLPAELTGASFEDAPRREPEDFEGRASLSEKLESLYRATGIPIVATSFRIPALDQKGSVSGSTMAALEDLSSVESCFLRFEEGVLEVRHPAYWLLECSEPPEKLVRQLEETAKKRPVTLAEYGALAGSLAQRADSGSGLTRVAFPHSYDRLLNLRGFLSKFDAKPLATAFPALYFFGALPSDQQTALQSGAVWDATQGNVRTGWGGRLIEATTAYNLAIDWVANAAPLFDAVVGPSYLTLAERGFDEAKLPTGRDALLEVIRDGISNPTMRGRFIWLERSGENSYMFKVGFGPTKLSAAFPITIGWKAQSRLY